MSKHIVIDGPLVSSTSSLSFSQPSLSPVSKSVEGLTAHIREVKGRTSSYEGEGRFFEVWIENDGQDHLGECSVLMHFDDSGLFDNPDPKQTVATSQVGSIFGSKGTALGHCHGHIWVTSGVKSVYADVYVRQTDGSVIRVSTPVWAMTVSAIEDDIPMSARTYVDPDGDFSDVPSGANTSTTIPGQPASGSKPKAVVYLRHGKEYPTGTSIEISSVSSGQTKRYTVLKAFGDPLLGRPWITSGLNDGGVTFTANDSGGSILLLRDIGMKSPYTEDNQKYGATLGFDDHVALIGTLGLGHELSVYNVHIEGMENGAAMSSWNSGWRGDFAHENSMCILNSVMRGFNNFGMAFDAMWHSVRGTIIDNWEFAPARRYVGDIDGVNYNETMAVRRHGPIRTFSVQPRRGFSSVSQNYMRSIMGWSGGSSLDFPDVSGHQPHIRHNTSTLFWARLVCTNNVFENGGNPWNPGWSASDFGPGPSDVYAEGNIVLKGANISSLLNPADVVRNNLSVIPSGRKERGGVAAFFGGGTPQLDPGAPDLADFEYSVRSIMEFNSMLVWNHAADDGNVMDKISYESNVRFRAIGNLVHAPRTYRTGETPIDSGPLDTSSIYFGVPRYAGAIAGTGETRSGVPYSYPWVDEDGWGVLEPLYAVPDEVGNTGQKNFVLPIPLPGSPAYRITIDKEDYRHVPVFDIRLNIRDVNQTSAGVYDPDAVPIETYFA